MQVSYVTDAGGHHGFKISEVEKVVYGLLIIWQRFAVDGHFTQFLKHC